MPSTTLSDICISELDVFRVLRSLDITKAKGCDGISPKLLKICALSLYQPLHHLFSLSLSQKYLPLEWRTHLIKPIFKSGDKSSIRNYRPISLLSVVSKVLEKLIFNNIVDFVSDSISVSQFGFLRGRSTLQQMLVFFNTLLSSASLTDVIYLDFKKALLFADDTKCIMPICSLQDCLNLQTDLSRLSDWCSTWNLPLNEEKCSAIHFKSRSSPSSFNYHLNGKQISSIAAHKDLGLFVSADLTWRSHYQLISSRAYKMLGLLRRVFSSSVSVPAKRSLYISLVRSQLLYCSSVWHPYLLVDIKYLECVQRRATKFIASNPLLDYRNRLIHLNLLPLMMEFELVDIMFLVKSVKFPSGHFNIHKFVQFCSHPTRAGHSFKLKHLLCRSNYERNFYFNRIPRLWNSLPFLDITLSLSVIKSKLRAYFWDHFMLSPVVAMFGLCVALC